MDAGDGLIGSGAASAKSDEERIKGERAKFVAELISLLEEAHSKDLLSFTAASGMNFEEVHIGVHFYIRGHCVVLGMKHERRPLVFERSLRICDSWGTDADWFLPFVMNDSTSEDEFLRTLRARLAGLHDRLKKEAPKNHGEFSNLVFEQNRFLANFRCGLTSGVVVPLPSQSDPHPCPF